MSDLNGIGGDAQSTTELAVDGMTCSGCARHVSDALRSLPAVASAGVSLEQRRATIRWSPGTTPHPDLAIEAVKEAGYRARVIEPTEPEAEKRWSPLTSWRFNAVVGLAAFLPLAFGEWLFHWGMERWFQWLAFVLASIVQVFCAARFYRGAWNQLKRLNSNMDTLVALGSTTAYAFSVWGLFSGYHGHLYFMEAVGIITLISIGHWLEARASSRASAALEKLLHLAPQTARIRNADGIETEVPSADLKPADCVILKPGDRIPVDGQLIEGAAAIDESMLTGESVPVDKSRGDKLYAGTVNINGHVLMNVTETGERTALAGIIAAVQRAQNSRADIQRLGDRVSSVFVPIVILLAIAAGLWWAFAFETAKSVHAALFSTFWITHVPETALAAAFIHAAAVLIVACPCAMGLATPAAIMAGTNAAAQRGILIRDGVALEKAGKITAVIFDKTGTLTIGKPTLAETELLESIDSGRDFEIKLAAALARRSRHPLSRAVEKLHSADLPLTQWQEIRGSGLQAQFQPNRVGSTVSTARLGSLKWLQESSGCVLSPVASVFIERWSSHGATVLGLAIEKKLVALFALQDAVKPHSPEVIRQLAGQKLCLYLITGDNQRTASAIAGQVGIPSENVFAEIRPEAKASLVQQLQQRGERVAFVGDGINDAPALEQADLGIAVSKASDVANEAADVILLNSEIDAIPEALGLAQATLRTIKQNLFWSFFYNAAGIPLAGLGFLSPILCAAAMGLSDLVVIGNALRLRRWKWRP